MAFVVRLDNSNSVLAYEKTFDPQGMLRVQAAGKMLAIFQVKKLRLISKYIRHIISLLCTYSNKLDCYLYIKFFRGCWLYFASHVVVVVVARPITRKGA